jgi:hypothetical protein
VLRGKYCRNDGIFDSFWIIKNGQTVSAWHQAWLAPGMVIIDNLDVNIIRICEAYTQPQKLA